MNKYILGLLVILGVVTSVEANGYGYRSRVFAQASNAPFYGYGRSAYGYAGTPFYGMSYNSYGAGCYGGCGGYMPQYQLPQQSYGCNAMPYSEPLPPPPAPCEMSYNEPYAQPSCSQGVAYPQAAYGYNSYSAGVPSYPLASRSVGYASSYYNSRALLNSAPYYARNNFSVGYNSLLVRQRALSGVHASLGYSRAGINRLGVGVGVGGYGGVNVNVGIRARGLAPRAPFVQQTTVVRSRTRTVVQ
jgi:hypothetical protein